MTPSKSAKIAIGLLNCCVPRSQGNDTLSGDLLEELHHGRSNWWCWQQVVVAVLRGWAATFRKRSSALLFAVVLSLPFPLLLVYGYSNQQFTSFYERLSAIAWPWSVICEQTILLAGGTFYAWMGGLLYAMAISYKHSRSLSCRRLSHGLLIAVGVLLVSQFATGVICLLVPFEYVNRFNFAPVQSITNPRLLLAHIPIIFSAFFSVIVMSPEPREHERFAAS